MRCSHKYAIDGTRLNAESTEHTLGIVNRIAGDLESLAVFDSLFSNVDAVDRTRLGTLITRYARRQVKAVKTSITGRNGYRLFGVLKLLGKCPAIVFVCN